jgi:hypothetical protein
MTSKTYSFASGIVFLVVAVVHAIRLINGWNVVMGSWMVPLWASWLGVIVAAFLAWQGLKHGGRRS